MPNKALIKIEQLVRTFFYTFLDISGILLGTFLIVLGGWIVSGRAVTLVWGIVVMLLGTQRSSFTQVISST
jgi:hypothetical protein